MNDNPIGEEALALHKKYKGKIEIIGKVALNDSKDLSIYYTPGVADVSSAIGKNTELSYEYTNRANTVAIVTDGTRVLGLGSLGPEAEMPIIEGKSILFKKFGGVDAIPIALKSKHEDDIVKFIELIQPSVAAINLEDIEVPKAFNIKKRLEKSLNIPIFHDDREGTAIVVRAALINALAVVGKKMKSAKIVINGAGSAGLGITEILAASEAGDITVCDSAGVIYEGRQTNMNEFKEWIAKTTNRNSQRGELADAVKGADVLIGASTKGAFTSGMIKEMGSNPIVFALANPDSEIDYKDAKAAGASIVATGRSDTPNQVNNYLAFPGFFRGMLSSRASRVTEEMVIAASDAIASSVKRSQRSTDYIIPKFGNLKEYTAMAVKIATRVADAAVKSGVAMVHVDAGQVKEETKMMLSRYSKIEKGVARLNKRDE
ncbi:MAG TPA: NADP-dependent malic enzyme [Candidatus Acidoferrum sp.]|nr:NADP-dependent malic enzyme [Candidatus Acidoferrum sp.]